MFKFCWLIESAEVRRGIAASSSNLHWEAESLPALCHLAALETPQSCLLAQAVTPAAQGRAGSRLAVAREAAGDVCLPKAAPPTRNIWHNLNLEIVFLTLRTAKATEVVLLLLQHLSLRRLLQVGFRCRCINN